MTSCSSSPTFCDEVSEKVTLHTHKSNSKSLSKLVQLFVPCCKSRPGKSYIENNNDNGNSKTSSLKDRSSDSVTIVDSDIIFPHGLQADNWIFRTGWTPQPDPLVIMQREWCSKCCRSARMEAGVCTLCGA